MEEKIYERTFWRNDVTQLNADNMNNIENGIEANRSAVALMDTKYEALNANLNVEINNRKEVDNKLSKQLNIESTERKNADNTLTEKINTEINNRKNSDDEIKAIIGKLENLASNIKTESSENTVVAAINLLNAYITLLNGEKSQIGSVLNTVTTEIAKVVADAPESYDTLKEIADYIASDKTQAASINNTLALHTTEISKIKADYETKADATVKLNEAKNYTYSKNEIDSKIISMPGIAFGTSEPENAGLADDVSIYIKYTE